MAGRGPGGVIHWPAQEGSSCPQRSSESPGVGEEQNADIKIAQPGVLTSGRSGQGAISRVVELPSRPIPFAEGQHGATGSARTWVAGLLEAGACKRADDPTHGKEADRHGRRQAPEALTVASTQRHRRLRAPGTTCGAHRRPGRGGALALRCPKSGPPVQHFWPGPQLQVKGLGATPHEAQVGDIVRWHRG